MRRSHIVPVAGVLFAAFVVAYVLWSVRTTRAELGRLNTLVASAEANTQRPHARRVVGPEKTIEALNARFVGEIADSGWSASTEASLTRSLSARLTEQSRARSVGCRRSICRIETSHADKKTYQAFLERGLLDPGFWPGPLSADITRIEPNGEVIAVAFLGRGEGSLLVATGE
jgi:hypothetical protein